MSAMPTSSDPTLAALTPQPQTTPMKPTSRYAGVGTATWTAPDGSAVPYLLRRFIPQPERSR